MAFEKGNDIKVSVGSTLIGGQQNCSINRETETSDTTTKDSGVWSEAEAIGLSWSVDLDGLVVVGDQGLEALETAWENLQQVDVKYGNSTNYKSGKAIITSLSSNSANKEKTTYSVSLQGVGALEKTGEKYKIKGVLINESTKN